MADAYQVVRDFESALCEYTGAPHAVTAMSCTMALFLAATWCLNKRIGRSPWGRISCRLEPEIEIPKRTYVGVAHSIIHAGARPTFRDEQWSGGYQLKPLPVYDYARRFTLDMYRPGQMQCVSFHWSKVLGIQQGGAILTDDAQAAAWLRRARFDGRAEGIPVAQDTDIFVGWHCYLSPEIAAEGLARIGFIPKHNADLPWDDYPDLSQMEIFK